MLSQSSLIQNIELDLGFKFTDLEITHDEIMKIIELRTLPEFSKYFPNQERININSERDRVPGYSNRYYIKTEGEVININRVIGGNRGGLGDIIVGNPGPHASMGSGNFLDRQIAADLASQMNPNTWTYHHPSMIEFAPNYMAGNMYIIVCNVIHSKHLTTVPTNMQDYFIRLASCDVRASLYLIRNRFSNLQTSFGSIELFIDDLSSAKDERLELIELFRMNSSKSPSRKRLWIG